MKLKEWRKSQKMHQSELAALLGVAQASISGYESENTKDNTGDNPFTKTRNTPRGDTMRKIILLTKGQVTANDWL
jgi:transcriptional regulator with XRE-family HTH domain